MCQVLRRPAVSRVRKESLQSADPRRDQAHPPLPHVLEESLRLADPPRDLHPITSSRLYSKYVLDVSSRCSQGLDLHQVQDTLFRVPREHFIMDSSVFRAMFSIPQCENSACDGSSDANPVKLRGIVKADFESLLKVMFPLYVPNLSRF